MSSGPEKILFGLRAKVRKFWGAEEAKFEKVWEVLGKEGKEKFGRACVEASRKMCGTFPSQLLHCAQLHVIPRILRTQCLLM